MLGGFLLLIRRVVALICREGYVVVWSELHCKVKGDCRVEWHLPTQLCPEHAQVGGGLIHPMIGCVEALQNVLISTCLNVLEALGLTGLTCCVLMWRYAV